MDPTMQNKLHQALSHDKIQSTLYKPNLTQLFDIPNHLPCLTHVIQLSVTAFLKKLKIDATNDDVEVKWDRTDSQVNVKEQGLLQTLEKVRHHRAYMNYMAFANSYCMWY